MRHHLFRSPFHSHIVHRAENTLADWDAVEAASTSIHDALPEDTQPAYYQLLHHAVIASANLQRMLIAAGGNQLRASQARLSTNDLADTVEDLFERDNEFEEQYHDLLDGKWNHMMDQTRQSSPFCCPTLRD